jgi:hypothetical protein
MFFLNCKIFKIIILLKKKINKESPAFGLLECNDIIQSIGRFPALKLRREEALNIIRMFDMSLPLVIGR